MNSSTTAAGRQMFEGVGAPVNLNRIDARMDPTLDACCQREVRRFSSILDAIILCCLLSSCFLIFSEVPAHHRSPRRGGGGPSIDASGRCFCVHSLTCLSYLLPPFPASSSIILSKTPTPSADDDTPPFRAAHPNGGITPHRPAAANKHRSIRIASAERS